MSATPSQPPATTSASEPVPVVSDIAASQPPPAAAANPAPVNGTAHPPDRFGNGASSGQTNPVPAPPPVSAQPTHDPVVLSVSYPPPSQKPPPPRVLPSTPFGQGAPQPQYRGQPIPSSYPPAPASQPMHSHYQAHSAQQVYSSSQPAQIGYQRQPAQQYGYQQPPPQQSSRPLIVDPPRKRSSLGLTVAMPPVHSASFPSPTKDYPSAFPKFVDDLSRNTLAIKQSVPEAVRQAVRDNWEKCLLGSEFHQAFVLNASLHHATPSVQSRAVHDFGANMVSNCKTELIEHFSNRDIDDVADLILAKASNAFLDKALEMRLATIDAKPLLNALARAERLGYDSQDLVEMSHGEHVIPSSGVAQMSAQSMGTGVSGPDRGVGNRAAQPNELQCLKCYHTFTKQSYFDYHMSRTVCAKIPPTADGFRYSCPKCGQGFTHIGGLSYHTSHIVCESGKNAPDEPQETLPATPVPGRSNASPGYATQQAHTPSSQPAKASTAHVLPANRPGGVSKAFSPSAADPYGHLTEEQMAALNAELLQAEEQYSGRFREAEAIADPEQRRSRLDSLRNTFGTKQSMIRKKFGVRLRERRTRAEIQAERERMGRNRLKSEARISGGEESPAPAPSTASAWTAASSRTDPTDLADNATPSLKRRRVDEGNEYSVRQQTGPTTKVSEMAGGLTASSATAAVHDPTLPPPSSQPALTYQQAGARVEIHLPSKSSPNKSAAASSSGAAAANGSGSREPDSMTPDVDAMETDDHAAPAAEEGLFVENDDAKEDEGDENESGKDNGIIKIDDDSDYDDDDDDDGDIPARLPPSVRQSLASSQLGPSR